MVILKHLKINLGIHNMFRILKQNLFSNFPGALFQTTTFILLLLLYLVARVISWILRLPIISRFISPKLSTPLHKVYSKAVKVFDYKRNKTISRINLIELAIRNMQSKSTRTTVTIGGMMIGIGSIVFLVSIGYGLQELVVTRVARLEEMRQTDVSSQAGGKAKITDKTLNDFSEISAIEMSLPLIAVVGRVNYQSSVSDMAVYGVTSDYLRQSAIQPSTGKIFDSNEIVTDAGSIVTEIMGEKADNIFDVRGEEIRDVTFAIDSGTWLKVRADATTDSEILGYTKKVADSISGSEVWGEKYVSDTDAGTSGKTNDDVILGKWVKTSVLLWKLESCDPESQGDCEDGTHMVMRGEDGQQLSLEGYIAEIGMTIAEDGAINSSTVLGDTTEISGTTDSNGTSLEWVEIASESGEVTTEKTKTVKLARSAKREAVVNRAMLQVLGITENEAVGKKFTASFVVVGELLSDSSEKIESSPAEYTIVGVTPEEKTPIFYVPFMDLRTLGITNYSQVKVVVKDKDDLSATRHQIEAMGYVTRSVADTVEQINSLFSTTRVILAVLGMIALGVAALGMFNTLTVSLLERTREVGLMKAMGMRSSEVQELFLTESMIMGILGGLLGIITGFLAGKLAGLVLSLFAVFQGVGYVDISYIPASFTVVIIILSLLVGILTGIYPAKRATKISALNALRYE